LSEDRGDKNKDDSANGDRPPEGPQRPGAAARPVRRPSVGESRIRPPSYSTARKPDAKQETPSQPEEAVEARKNGAGQPSSDAPAPKTSERQRLFDIEGNGAAKESEEQDEPGKTGSGFRKTFTRAFAGVGAAAGKAGASTKKLPSRFKKDPAAGEASTKPEKPRREWHVPRWARIVVAVFALWLVVTVIAGVALEIANIGKISKGVKIDGIPVGGMTTSGAVAKVTGELKPLTQPLVFKFKDRQFSLGMDTVKLQVQPSAMVSMAYIQGRGSFLPLRMAKGLLGAGSDVNVPVLFNLDKAQLANFVASIAKTVNVDPVSSSIVLKDGSPVIMPSADGVTVQQEDMIKAAMAALGKKDRAVEVVVKYKKPEIVDSDVSKIVVVQLSKFTLYLYNRTELMNEFTIACGMPQYPTPPGKYHITYKERNPTWLPTSEWAKDKQGVPQPPGPNNPLGGYWMDLGGGLGIHETPFPKSLGSAASHGCIRMSNEGASTVFNAVNVGTPVFIIP
jgi:lipoprotein-anchoring transpeptidase ErfK/SrfK